MSTVIQILLKRVNVQKGIYNYLHEFFIFNLNVTKKNKQGGAEMSNWSSTTFAVGWAVVGWLEN